MIITQRWFMSSARSGNYADVVRDEPSHIHIARPSRQRQDTMGSTFSIEQTSRSGELRELDSAATQVPLQAA